MEKLFQKIRFCNVFILVMVIFKIYMSENSVATQ